VSDFLKARVQVKHFCWRCLLSVNEASRKGKKQNGITDFGVFATLEERSDANETNIIIPHHNVFLLVSRNFESVLENCHRQISKGQWTWRVSYLRSFLDLFSQGSFSFRCCKEYDESIP